MRKPRIRWIWGRNVLLLVFRGVPPCSAVVHCARFPGLSLLYFAHRPLPSVSKSPKRWVAGDGGGNAKTSGPKSQKPRRIVGFEGVAPFVWRPVGFRQVPPGSVRFRCGPLPPLPFTSILYFTSPPTPGVSKPTKRWVMGKGGGECANARPKSAKTAKIKRILGA